MKVIEAPQWLKDRMEKLKQLPPPTLVEVKTQLNCWQQLQRQQEEDVARQIDEEFLGRVRERLIRQVC